MTSSELNLVQEIDSFVQMQLNEWLAENPEPDSIPEMPEMPESKFVPITAGGFIVLEVLHTKGIRLHISVPNHSTRYIDVINKDFIDLIEQLLILQADMQTRNIWDSQYKNAVKERQQWYSDRAKVISDARREFIEAWESKS